MWAMVRLVGWLVRKCKGFGSGDGRRKQSSVQARVGSAEELSVLPCSARDFRVLHLFCSMFLPLSLFC